MYTLTNGQCFTGIMCDDVYAVSWNRTITSQLMTVTVTCYQNEPRDVYGIYQTGTKYYNTEVFVELKLCYSHEFSHI